MQHIIEEFNRFFEGDAKIEIRETDGLHPCGRAELEITIGTRSLIIGLASVVGGQSVSKDQ